MARSLIAVRPISPDERAVLERAVRVAAVDGADIPALDQLERLQVVGTCECGCATVQFRYPRSGEIHDLVADAIGETSAGERVGILVFAADGQFTGLEIVGYSDFPASLPVASTIRGYAVAP